MGRLVNSDKIKPDLELLKSAISICKAATKNGYYGYSTVFLKNLKVILIITVKLKIKK